MIRITMTSAANIHSTSVHPPTPIAVEVGTVGTVTGCSVGVALTIFVIGLPPMLGVGVAGKAVGEVTGEVTLGFLTIGFVEVIGVGEVVVEVIEVGT